MTGNFAALNFQGLVLARIFFTTSSRKDTAG